MAEENETINQDPIPTSNRFAPTPKDMGRKHYTPVFFGEGEIYSEELSFRGLIVQLDKIRHEIIEGGISLRFLPQIDNVLSTMLNVNQEPRQLALRMPFLVKKGVQLIDEINESSITSKKDDYFEYREQIITRAEQLVFKANMFLEESTTLPGQFASWGKDAVVLRNPRGYEQITLGPYPALAKLHIFKLDDNTGFYIFEGHHQGGHWDGGIYRHFGVFGQTVERIKELLDRSSQVIKDIGEKPGIHLLGENCTLSVDIHKGEPVIKVRLFLANSLSSSVRREGGLIDTFDGQGKKIGLGKVEVHKNNELVKGYYYSEPTGIGTVAYLFLSSETEKHS